LRARKARLSDVAAIHALIASYAAQGILLPRTEENVREHFSTFLVLEEKSKITGCVSLENYGADLAEIRSLAVSPEIRGRGLGGRLVEFALLEARREKIARVFAVTHAPEFFVRHGFAASSRRALPEKIERDCSTCPKARRCKLIAVIATALPEQVMLPILDGVASPSLA
jgi:N-acetylglutamate synthase-like GNAT family acetyltransferase